MVKVLINLITLSEDTKNIIIMQSQNYIIWKRNKREE